MPRFLIPGFLWGAAAVLVPLILHLLRRRRAPARPLPSLGFLRQARENTRNHRWRRWLVLALRCAALILLAAAFARPFYAVRGVPGRATVVVVDETFSLQASGRWPALHSWAADLIGDPAPGDSLGLVAMGNHPRWLAPIGEDTAEVRRTFAALRPGWESGRVEPSLRMAAEVLAARPNREKRIVVMSDEQAVAWSGTDFARKIPPGIAVYFADPSPPPVRQAALAAPAVERASADPAQTSVRVDVVSFSSVAQSRTLRVFGEDRAAPLAQSTFALAPGETRTVRLAIPGLRDAAWIRLALDPDDVPADDTAYCLVPEAAGATRTVYVDAAPPAAGVDYPAAALASAAALKPAFRIQAIPAGGELPVGVVAILRNAASFTGPGARRLDEFLRTGGRALVFLDGEIAAAPWWGRQGLALTPLAERADPWTVHDWTVEHPMVAPFAEYGIRDLLGWEFKSGWALPRTRAEPLGLWTDNSVAVGEIGIGPGQLLVCGFPADRRLGDWVASEAFVPFLHRALIELGRDALGPATRLPLVGEPIALPPAKGVWTVLAGPDIGRAPEAVENQVTPATPGVYRFETGGRRFLWAVGLPLQESDLAPWPDGAPWAGLVSTQAGPGSRGYAAALALHDREAEEKTGRWWGYLALAALAFFGELLLANRTAR